tara:strand:- start:50 stop:259 length:210 start_codon:yes stop_codon:yes gene_type:complete
MNKKFPIIDILEAVNILLNDNSNKSFPKKHRKDLPLKLTNEITDSKSDLDILPTDTEKIILEAEKYLKK